MDLCYKRYSNPFELLSFCIEEHNLSKFILDLDDNRKEEQVWDVWLYKCQDKSFEDFRKSVLGNRTEKRSEESDKADIEKAVESSRNVLADF